MKIFVSIPTDSLVMKTFLPDFVKSYMEECFDVEYSGKNEQLSEEELNIRIKDSDVLLTGWGHEKVTAKMLAGTKVKLIVHTGGSVGSLVDMELYDMGIRVLSGNLLYAESVAEGTIAYILSGLRKIPDFVNRVREGEWRKPDDYTKGLLDRTVGIVGLGTISTILIKMLQIFNVRIKIYSSYPVPKELLEKNNAVQTTLDEVLSSDIVTLHSAMNERTRGMIGCEEIKQIKDGALLINTARGRIVDEAALIEELKKNRFSAVLDVSYNEPPTIDSPLRNLSNVYYIPHLAGPTYDRRPIITKQLIDSIKSYENGESIKLEISKEMAMRMTIGG